MADFKLVIGDSKTKRTFKTELKAPDSDQLLGKKIGDKFRGELIGMPGFELEITGGTDKAGFAMYSDLEGPGRRRLILDGTKGGYAVPKKYTGKRKRKLVHGNEIELNMVQINCKITKHGELDLMKHFNVVEKTEEKKEEAPAEQPAA